MLKKLILMMAGLLIVGTINADVLTIPDHPDKHIVVKGDTLWDIAGRFLTKPWRWPEIWENNRQIENPHLIYPGDVIFLIYRDGQPVLSVSPDGTTVPTALTGEFDAVRDAMDRKVKLSPTIRELDSKEAIPPIPIDVIRPFLDRPVLISAEEFDERPYIVSNYDQHLYASEGNKIYIRGLPEDSHSTDFSIYRKGRPYSNPLKDEDEILGYEAIYVGDAVLERHGDPATAIITLAKREILTGDRLYDQVSDQEDALTQYIPHPPRDEVIGNIISVYDGLSSIGSYMIVVLDVGQKDGVEIGNVLGVYQRGMVVKDRRAEERDKKSVQLPTEKAGVLMVFKLFEHLSYAIVMEAVRPIHILDEVGNL